ncbi:hypothetical protein BJ508DRAFT_310284 [Ascobolus immersus RN42]|uniref:Uncharacterized protein n=1 Tax=Ascobolus immersus RN42 TaxID=1160509 RepID=A0A3N4HTZ0_ASCIM|nr:hypothetical protein BJ508DRAFT_310284 [Ascobolus immersus RN42]
MQDKNATGDGEWKNIGVLEGEYEALREGSRNFLQDECELCDHTANILAANPQYWDEKGNLRYDKVNEFNSKASESFGEWLEDRLDAFPDYEDMTLEQLVDIRLRQGQFLTLEEVVAWVKEANLGLAKKDNDHPIKQHVRNAVLTYLAEQRHKGNLQVGERPESGRIVYRLMGNRK